jgi:glucose/mannose-6-phosphate isomerase
VISLDDEAALAAADPRGMLAAVLAMPSHAREGYRIGRGIGRLPSVDGVTAITYCGMGGSAVAGDVFRALAAGRLPLPVEVIRGSSLPEYCGPHTLVLVSSYSGDTAEALACFEEAIRRGCRTIAVTSGGTLAARAGEVGAAVAIVPGGFVPRAAFGYLSLGWLGVLETAGLMPPLAADVEESAAELERIVATGAPSVPTSANPTKTLATAIGARTPVIWGGEGIGAVAAMRWKTQLNENAKVPAWSSSLPELDHNEIVGWSAGSGSRSFVVALRDPGEPREISLRFPLSLEIARDAGARTEEVHAQGRSALARLLSLVLVGDLTATYLGLARRVDPTEMDAIVRLKQELARA